tara:strand:+ start:3732 stop:4439 length:708 start_codon:yes stop_codon:yes gene_type:complete
MNKDRILFVTFTNSGYINFTQNLIQSTIDNNVDIDLKVFTIDKASYDYFIKSHNNVEMYEQSTFSEELLEQKADNFGNLMMVKFDIIYKSLLKHKYVGYIDGDIVIKKNIDDYILKKLIGNDIVFQNDKRPSKPNLVNVCAGFMIINSNKKTKKFFQPTKSLESKFVKYTTHDQTHINKNRNKFKHEILPLNDFPNGPHFYKNHKELNPYMIHFNFLLGEKKEDYMKKYKEWYLK